MFKSIERRKEYHRDWYSKNKRKRIPQIVTDRKRRKKIARAFVDEYLYRHPCTDCGNTNRIVLDFDHLKDKKYHVSVMVNDGRKITAIQKEIEKCDVVCSNCHRIRTSRRRKIGE